MATAFTRTLRSLETDSTGRSASTLCGAAALLAGWIIWSVAIPISLYETTTSARLEAGRSTSAIQSPVAGKIVESRLMVGQEVAAGDLLLQLDASSQTLQLDQKRAEVAALDREIAGLRSQVAAEGRARGEEQHATLAAEDEARAGEREAQAPARYNAAELARLQQLRENGLISERDYQKGRAEAEQSRAAVERQGVTVTKIEREQRVRDSERDTRVRKLETDIARLEGEISTKNAEIEVLRNDASRYSIRAPIAGRIGEAATLRAGSVVAPGDKLGAIVPSGRIQIIAQFPPSALGRIAPGQPAAMRLEGFPWAQYGALNAVVSKVAGEIRDGSVRVELAVDRSQPTRIPLDHGLPGTLEIQVERATPAALVLRNAGRMLTGPRGTQIAEAR